MTGLSRRETLAGFAALAAPCGAKAATVEDARLRAILDALPRHDPAEALTALAAFDPARLSLSPRLDLLTIRAGLAIDRQLAALGAGATSIVDVPPSHRAAYYRLLLARRLGDIDLDTARARLTAELDRLTDRTDRALVAIGLHDGGVGVRLTRLMADERFLYPDSDAGRDRAVADMNRALAARRAQVPQAFDVPPWCLDVAVGRTRTRDEVAGKRTLPTPQSPGGYIVDLRDIRRRPSWTLGSVVAHELLPGHLLQLPLEAAAGMHPARADYAAAFVEGWAIYAENFAAEQGAFDGDGLAMVGHFHWLLFRVARARADIGLHVDGWSVDRTRAFLEQHQGPAVYFAPYDVELTRMPREPAVRAAEALAWLAIADAAPVDRRRRKGFHEVVLAGGRKRLEQVAAWRDRVGLAFGDLIDRGPCSCGE